MTFVIRLLWFVAFLSLPSGIDLLDSEVSLLQQRKAFVQAELYIQQHRDEDYLIIAESLKDYVLYPYLHYQWLSEHLQDQNAVQQFLLEYVQSRYASLLHDKWLRYLGESRDWLNFLRYYKPSDDEALQCYWALALLQQKQPSLAESKARELWLTGKSLPVACESGLAETLPEVFQDDRGLLWQRFRNALLRDNQPLINKLINAMRDDERHRAELWLNLHRRPKSVAEPGDWKHNDPEAGVLFAHAIERWQDDNPVDAVRVWEDEQAGFLLPEQRRSEVERVLALGLAVRRDPRAFDRLSALMVKDGVSREWRVRAALFVQDWAKVLMAIADLEPGQRQQPKWLYWQARALEAMGQGEMAKQLFSDVARDRSIYGVLAADFVGIAVDWQDKPLQVASHELAQLQASDEFQAFAELRALQRSSEAKRQWRHAISHLSAHDLMLAAKLAQYWQVPALAISTIAKAGVWDDLSLRFPLHHLDAVERQAQRQHIEPSVILGLIRQESAFDATAESSVGAKGLMQLMPATAQEMATQEHITWSDPTLLFEPSLNVELGSAYFGKLMKRFQGRYLPAIAAYNAGPNRVKQWLPLDRSLPGDIWMEIIPYKETRNYVAAVVSNSLIYQKWLLSEAPKSSDLLSELRPYQN